MNFTFQKIKLLLITVFTVSLMMFTQTSHATTCGAAQVIPAVPTLPYTVSSIVCGTTNDIASATTPTCGSGSYRGGLEALYVWTPTSSYTGVTVAYTGQTWSGIFVYNGCPGVGGTTCVTNTTSSGSSKTTSAFSVTAGTTYYILFDTWPSPASPCAGSFTLNGSIVLPSCSGMPAGGTTNGPTNACASTPFLLTVSGSPAAPGQTFRWESAPDVSGAPGTWSPIATSDSASKYVSQTATTWYRRMQRCNATGDSAYSTQISVGMNSRFVCYCPSTHSSGCGSGDEITRVQIPTTTLDNTSTCSAGAYGYFNTLASHTASLTQYSSYTLNVSFGTDGSQFFGAWIDYNSDGVFNNTTEFLGATAATAGASGTSSITFTVPGPAVPGLTRLRVVGGNDVAVLSTNFCGASSSAWGETEDYDITIVAAVPCTGMPSSGTSAVSPTSSSCTVNANLSVTGHTTGLAGIIYRWQSSPAGAGTWANISGANSPTYTATSVSASTDYRLMTVCTLTNDTAYSTTSTITISPSATLPWTENFDAIALGTDIVPPCMAVQNVSSNWFSVNYNSRSGTQNMRRSWSTNGWLFTPPVSLTAGVSYDFSYWYRSADATTPAYNHSIRVGTANNIAAMTTFLDTLSNTNNTAYAQKTVSFIPPTTGIYYFGLGIQAPFDPNGFHTDDWMVRQSPTCGDPISVAAGSITGTGFTATWAAGSPGTPSNYVWNVRNTLGTIVVSGTTTTTSVVVTGLSSSTNYTFSVRSDCVLPDTSSYVTIAVTTGLANDAICDAIQIWCGSSGLAGTTLNSQPDVTPDCAVWSGTETPRRGVWYKVVGNDSQMTVNLCNAISYDSRISVFTASSCSSALTCIAGNDDIGAACSFTFGFPSSVTFNAYSGNTYYILVHGYAFGGPSATGNFIMGITCNELCLPLPTNDTCAASTTVTMTPYGTCTPTTGSTKCASPSVATPPGGSVFATYNDVWYRFQATATTAIVRLDSLTSATKANNIGFVIYNNDTCGTGNIGSAINAIYNFEYTVPGLTVGNFYRIQVLTNVGSGLGGTFNLCVTQTPPPAPNDTICRAVNLSGTADVCTPVAGSVAYGSNSGIALTPCSGTAFNDMWYKFTANRSSYQLDVNNGGSGVTYYAQVVTGPCTGPNASVSCLTSFPSSFGGLTVGQTYYIRVYTPFSIPGAAVANYTICLQRNPAGPANDELCAPMNLTPTFATATPYSATGFANINPHSDTIIGNNTNAWFQLGEPIGSCGLSGTDNKTLWYSVKAPFCATPQVIISTEGPTTDFDTRLSVYRRNVPSSCTGGYTEIACDDDGGTVPIGSSSLITLSPNSSVSLTTPGTLQYAPGEDLYIQASGFGTASGNYGLIIDAEPYVPTASNVRATMATINWSPIYTNSSTWGPAAGAYVQWRPVGAASTVAGTWRYVAAPIDTLQITGLMPNTAYEFWASYPCGNGGRWWSKKSTFTTPATCTGTSPTISSVAVAPSSSYCNSLTTTFMATDPVYTYRVIRKRVSSSTFAVSPLYNALPTAQTWLSARLAFGETYEFWVVAFCAGSRSDSSGITPFTVCSSARTSAPTEDKDVVYILPNGDHVYGMPVNLIDLPIDMNNPGEQEITLQTIDANTYFGTTTESTDDVVVAKGDVRIYPNPASTEATISYTLAEKAEQMNIRVVDAQGKEMMNRNVQQPAESGEFSINLNNYSGGIYFVKIQAGDFTTTKKLVVEKN